MDINYHKHVTILVPKGDVVFSSLTGGIEIFGMTSQFMMATGKADKPFFKVELVGYNDDKGLAKFNCTHPKDFKGKTDLIIIPAIPGDIVAGVEKNMELADWIVQQHKRGAEVASLCVGAFLLAETGLLDGRKCTTHWSMVELFRNRYPQITVYPERIIIDENGIYSSGGAYSFLNLLLYLIDKFCGKDVALWASKMFEIDISRSTQSPFMIFETQKKHSDNAIQKAQQLIEQKVSDRITVQELADASAMSLRTFIRRFKAATGNTPIEYIQRTKIETAKRKLEEGSYTVNEIVYDLGYNDVKAFRNIFRKYTGLPPAKYKEKYARHYA